MVIHLKEDPRQGFDVDLIFRVRGACNKLAFKPIMISALIFLPQHPSFVKCFFYVTVTVVKFKLLSIQNLRELTSSQKVQW